ncbi:MAG: hypothetical protein M1839_003351 [Geoglossum umbratile]|nr:MAG: hypothetical protein M1839_003351 [Geoglossum umbratile]
MAQATPEVLWAQRSSSTDAAKNFIYLTIATPDVPASSLDLKLTPTSLTFTGRSETKKITYHVEIEFYGEIDVENSKTNHTARDVEIILRKKELATDYWPRLLKDSKKVHYLKTDFDKWVDEDEQDGAPDEDYMNNFGGAGGMGGGDGGFGGIDFSKLGGGGMGDMGDMGDMSGLGGADDDDDDELPDLEDESKDAPAEEAQTDAAPATETAKPASPKIEELS